MLTAQGRYVKSESAFYDATVAKLRARLVAIDGAIVTNLASWEEHCRLVGQREATVADIKVLEDEYTDIYGALPGGGPDEENDGD